MVKEEVSNKKRVGFFSALKAMFASDEEKINEEDKKEIEALNAESAKNIKSLEDRILADKKQSRKNLSDNLKVEKINEVSIAKETKKKERNDNEKENDEFVK